MRAKRVMSANLPRNKTEGNRYHVDAFRLCADRAVDVATRPARSAQLTNNYGMALLLVVNQCDGHWFSLRIRASRRQGQRFPVRRNREPATSMIFSARVFCIIGKRIGVYLLDRDAVIRRSLT